jgi:hypothetical protein
MVFPALQTLAVAEWWWRNTTRTGGGNIQAATAVQALSLFGMQSKRENNG